jgi:tetratricopeptide (TPR) repeat protein
MVLLAVGVLLGGSVAGWLALRRGNGRSASVKALPPLHSVTRADGTRAIEIDETALAQVCRSAGLPAPPPPDSVDSEAYQLIYNAVREAVAARSAETVGRLGAAYEGNGFVERGLVCYEQAVKLDPQAGVWWHLLGEAQLNKGDGDAALAALTRASALDPQNTAALALRGNLLIERGAFAEAEECYRRYVQSRPQDPLGHFALGRIALATGDAAGARSQLEETIKYAERYQQAHLLLARALERLGEQEAARRSLELAAAYKNEKPPSLHDPNHADVLRSGNSTMALQKLMVFYSQSGRNEEAYKLAQQIVARRPDDYSNYRNLGALGEQTGRPSAAIEHYRHAIALNPRYVEGYVALARVLRDQNQDEEALQAINQALSLDASNAAAASVRTSLLAKLHRKE